MSIRNVLGVVLFCASCGFRHAEGSGIRAVYTPQNNGMSFSSESNNGAAQQSVHTPQHIPTVPPSGNLSFVGAPGPAGAFKITTSVQMPVSKPVIVPQQATGTGYSTATYGTPTGGMRPAQVPHPKSQILYGWVPEPRDDIPQNVRNTEELENALRSRMFVTKLWSRALSEKACRIVSATDRQSYLEVFWETVAAERRFRQDADNQRTIIENELRENQMAGASMSYAAAIATQRNLQEHPGKDLVSEESRDRALRYKETVDRVMAVRLEILMSCKLAALLAQPDIFLNPNFSVSDVLGMIATALGVGASEQQGTKAGPAFGGLEPFLMASNPITLGHLLILLIGYIDKELFFGEKSRKPFYSFSTLVGATGGETAVSMLDDMCDRDRGPRFKTAFFKKYRPVGRDGKPRVRGSTRPWFVRGTRRVHKNKQQPGLLRAYCDATEMLLNAIMIKQDDIQQEMLKFSVPVEPLVDPATNAARIQTRTCRGEAPVCSFENTILNPVGNPLDPQVMEQNTQTRAAFDLYVGLASAQLGNLLDVTRSGYSEIRSEQWVDVISKPTAYSEILEKVFYYDRREVTAKGKSKFVKQFDAYAKRIEELAGRTSITFEEASATYKAIQTKVTQFEKKWYKRNPKITIKNLFRVASILMLRTGNIACDMRLSFAESFEQFTKFMFASGEGKGKRSGPIQRSLMMFFRTGKSPLLHSMCSFDPLALNYLFLYRFVLLGQDAARTHDAQHAAVSKTKLSTRLLNSKVTPSFLKTIMRGFRRKTLVQSAKKFLLEGLDPSVLPALITSFDWIVHTQATLQLNQNSAMYHELGMPPQSYQTSAERKSQYKLSSGGLVKLTDKQLQEWAEYGIPEALNNKLRKGGKLPKTLAMEKIPTADLTKWEMQLNTKWLEGLNAYLQHPYGQAALAANDPVALLIKESRNRLEEELDSTIFLGRIVKAPRVSKFKRALRAVTNFFRMLLRAPEQSEYAVWMGVKINIDKVLSVMKAVNNAAEVVKSSGMYNHIKEGFLEIVKDVIMGNLDSHHRIVGYDTYAAIDEQMRKEGLAAAYKRNHGFLSIHHDYANLSEAERKREFQLSMCMDHCEGLWKLIASLVLTNLQNPQKLAGYEKEMQSTKAIAALNDPNRVNAFRLGLNVQTDFFDNMLDKGSKENIKRMKFGGGTWFAYSLLFAGRVNTAMGLANLGTTLAFQAPYYGNFILRWLKERREARKKAIFAMLTLGFFFAYTFLSVSDITQHLTDSGLGPAVECLENLVVGPICPAEVVAPAISNAAQAAAQDVFKVGIFGLLTPYLVWPMMLISVWQILKSEFKILLQFEMSVKSLFTRFGRWAKQPFSKWWKNKKRMKEGIMKRASQKYENEKRKNNGREPQARDFVGRSDSGNRELDALGLPPAGEEVSFDITSNVPVYPFSPPLVRASTSRS